MKSIFLLFSIFLFLLSCKKESTSPCENGRYDEGEIGVDCGGNCADCIFDKNDILDKAWKDVPSDFLIADNIRLVFHQYSPFWNQLNAVWSYDSLPGDFIQTVAPNWEWVNESDTLKFPWVTYGQAKRKIMFVGEDFYKFKTNQDGWKYIYSATLEN